MNQPGKVKAKLLAIIVFDEVERLHVPKETWGSHAPWKFQAVHSPWLFDIFSFGHVHWEVFKYDTTFTQVVHIHFLLKRLRDDGLMLAAIELVKLIRSIALKRLRAVVLG